MEKWVLNSLYFYFWRYTLIKELLTNDQIRVKTVRLVGSDGAPLGIVSIAEAMQKANEADLDLVLLSPNAEPPVCKIMDYGKFRYHQEKRQKEAKSARN